MVDENTNPKQHDQPKHIAAGEGREEDSARETSMLL